VLYTEQVPFDEREFGSSAVPGGRKSLGTVKERPDQSTFVPAGTESRLLKSANPTVHAEVSNMPFSILITISEFNESPKKWTFPSGLAAERLGRA
jgi:hypothetical protein